MSHDVVAKLSQTEKGRMQYGVERDKHSRFFKDPQLFMKLSETSVFDLKQLGLVLENCEECAYAEESRHTRETKHGVSKLQANNPKTRNHPIEIIQTSCDMENFKVHRENVNRRAKEENVCSKSRQYENALHQFSNQAEEKFQQLKVKRLQKHDAIHEELKRYIAESEETAEQMKRNNIEQHESRSKTLLTRIEEAENRRRMKLEQGKQCLLSAQPAIANVKQLNVTFTSQLNDERSQNISSDPDLLSLHHNFNIMYSSVMMIVDECTAKGLMEAAEHNQLLTSCNSLEKILMEALKRIEYLQLLEAEREKRRKEELQIEEERAEKARQLELVKKQKELANKDPENSFPSLPKELMLSVSRAAYHGYMELKTLLIEHETIKKQFVSDKNNMKVVMAVNKAISVPISSITDRSGSDLKNKLNDLKNVLKGVNIKVGNKIITLEGPAKSYAYFCMAQKFVKQAESQVSSNHNAAFCLALALVSIWSEHELFGKLLLAQLQSKCPFIVPWCVPQLPGQSEVEYNKKRGYLYDEDGGVEKQDIYLGRMSGLVRIYAAIIQSPLPPGVRSHPHGVAEGWKWLARMLYLDPWPEVTATVLYDFLDVAGHALMNAYSKQFHKLLYALCHDYYLLINEVSGDGGGPLQRLQMFLKDCIKLKDVSKPDGYLDQGFWNTYHHSGVVGS